MTQQVCEAFDLIAQLCIAMNEHPLTKHAGCWECVIDGRWKIAVNGHDEPKVSSLNPEGIDPFHCHVEYNGWPAGILNPYGGVIAAGAAANEDAFIKAIRTKIAALQESAHDR